MLSIKLPENEVFDDNAAKFVRQPELVLQLEHSLLSISKWESAYEKPFLKSERMSQAELLYYIQCMRLDDGHISDLLRLNEKDFKRIGEYMNAKNSSTTFYEPEESGRSRGETITSELVYYWMVTFQIPFEAETWHFQRLMALIKICSVKNSNKKVRRRDVAAQNRALNAQRLAQNGGRG